MSCSAGTGLFASINKATRTHRWRACPTSKGSPSSSTSTSPSNRNSAAISHSLPQAGGLRADSRVGRIVERLQRHRDRVQLPADVDLVAACLYPVGVDDSAIGGTHVAEPHAGAC